MVFFVEIPDIDPIGLEAGKALVDAKHDVPPTKARIELRRTAAGANLCRDNPVRAILLQQLAKELLGISAAVAIRRIDEIDAVFPC